ncbi:hypothetical protein SADFL11_00005690 [Roseibium alexandrii DFL-11]|uniref:Uncharacterized protein n=1 Tax=Roseibium alexandrii (strain DSM 17067 / NCIMB 14079 / DFL-11) TaxID=244592 RepID=A0A5E8UXK2_ROSAD|nr:hypothetical protein SADFL11_00005690 [Roseibium alexandrii DFL-11]
MQHFWANRMFLAKPDDIRTALTDMLGDTAGNTMRAEVGTLDSVNRQVVPLAGISQVSSKSWASSGRE